MENSLGLEGGLHSLLQQVNFATAAKPAVDNM